MTSESNKSTSKIKVSIGNVKFSGTGSDAWLADQLDKVLKIAASHPASLEKPIANAAAASPAANGASPSVPTAVGSLASYLKAKDATTNQNRRFLTTSAWLTKKGSTSMKTADVSKALKDNQQSKLSNPSDCLNQNVGKGFCEKTGDGFFVTPEGWTELADSA